MVTLGRPLASKGLTWRLGRPATVRLLAVSFSDAFWPALWAAIIAVAVGIPAGLQVARLEAWLEKRVRRQETVARTCAGLDGLLVALRAELATLRRMPVDLETTAVGLIPIIMWRPQQAVWDLLSPVVLEGVANTKLKLDLARCFELMQGTVSLLDRLYELESAALGPDPYAFRARATADQLKLTVKSRVAELAAFIEDVCSEAETYLAAHRPHKST
jgi:hypothetical protein